MTNSTDHLGWRPLPAPGPVITLLSTSWERRRWRRDFRRPQGCVLTAAWLPPWAQVQGNQRARRARWGQFPRGLARPRGSKGLGRGLGAPVGRAGRRQRSWCMGLGRGACSHKGCQEGPDVREPALWKGNWVHQESRPSMLGAKSLASTSTEGGTAGGRRSVRTLSGGRKGRGGPGHKHIWSCPPVSGDQFLAALPGRAPLNPATPSH